MWFSKILFTISVAGLGLASAHASEPTLKCEVFQIEGKFTTITGEQPRVGDRLSVDLNQTELKKVELKDDGGTTISLEVLSPLVRRSLTENGAEYFGGGEGWLLKLTVASADGIKNMAIIKEEAPKHGVMYLDCAH